MFAILDVLVDFLLVVQLQMKNVAIYARVLTMTPRLGFKFHYECLKLEVNVNMTHHFFNMGRKTNSRCGLLINYRFNLANNGKFVAYIDKMKHSPFQGHFLPKTNTIS